MNTALDCIPCLVRSALDAARLFTDDPAVHERIVREVLQTTADMDLSIRPPLMAQRIHRRLRELTGNGDPYGPAKVRFNALAAELLPALEAELDAAADPFNMAVRLAIAGNIIDLGPNLHLSEAHIRESLEQALATPLDGDSDAFRREVDAARDILYLADNAGEIYFDRPLLKRLPQDRVTVAVRGLPVLNDATMKDAREAGLHELARLMDNGSDAPGTVLEDCHDAFRAAFEGADLIIAKGQGNFETLIGCGRPVWYLFKAKCAVVAREVGKPLNTHLLMREPEKN